MSQSPRFQRTAAVAGLIIGGSDHGTHWSARCYISAAGWVVQHGRTFEECRDKLVSKFGIQEPEPPEIIGG